MTVRLPRDATLAAAARKLGLSEDDVDAGYGLVPLDPATGLYGVRVSDEAARRVRPEALTEEGEGVHADPRIEPFGPPRPGT
ncbi:hypothetical protein FHX40_2441 [Thermopolyspora flexuosa]|uniref:Uncharacterized protein n=2 Tax=Thermopolyspora flexuosa TaxID=103836 RepID=A0A543IYS6_9ACTN|nr:hypothetical protein FHX40_2441 [Thermopolyspora flexuosa]